MQHHERLPHRDDTHQRASALAEPAFLVQAPAAARRGRKMHKATGLSGVPPPGPGDTGDRHHEFGREWASAPAAMLRAVSAAHRAKARDDRPAGTPSISVLAAVE